MRNLLNDRLFYLAFFCMQYGRRSLNSYEWYLWEIMGTNPGVLLEFCFTARSHGQLNYSGHSFVEDYLNSMDLKEPESFESFLDSIEIRLEKPNLVPSFKSQLEKLTERLSQLRQDLADHDLGKNFLSLITS